MMENMKSENISAISKALSVAQGQMSHATKDSVNPHFRSKYADLASVWEAIRKPLSDNGLCVTQSPYGNVLVTMISHESGEWIKSETPIFNGKGDAQGYGSGLTYARRYALASIAGVAQDDDDANMAQPVKRPQQQQTQQKPNLNDPTDLLKASGSNGWNAEQTIEMAEKKYTLTTEIKTFIAQKVAERGANVAE